MGDRSGWKWALVALSAAIVAIGCGMLVDDQRIATPAERAVVNPPPSPRDFRLLNSRHAVLLAVIDTGVDYNHPLLINNMHFTLDFGCKPVRIGRDYTGDDGWPAPYLARTAVHDRRLSEEQREYARRKQEKAIALVRRFPDLQRFFNPLRDVVQEETASVLHGTHVAGLMVYDRPDLGLLPYRVLPYNRTDDPEELDRTFFRSLRAAIDDAVADGARVINLSLGITAHVDSEELERVTEEQRAFRRLVARHSDVLFVAAAGNSGRIVGGRDVVSFPCGVRAPNVFCVGALTDREALADFTNIPARGIDAVFAFGEDVLSTIPTDLCEDMPLTWLISDDAGADDLGALVRAARSRCIGRRVPLAQASGTSMAAPIVARLAGTILAEDPGLSPTGVIKEIRRRARFDKIDNLPVAKLHFEKPSWYSRARMRAAAPDSDALPAPAPETALEEDSAEQPWTAYLPLLPRDEERSSTGERRD